MSTMLLGPLDHFTLRCRPQDLAELRAFYADVLGLVEGARPAFAFPGHWLYSGDRPIVHLAGTLAERPAAGQAGGLDHVSFQGSDLPALRQRLREHGIRFNEVPVPGFPLWQVFLHDPQGLRLEVTFRLDAPGQESA